jgi:hypothetical protein
MTGRCDAIREITCERLRRRVVCDARSCEDIVGFKKWVQVDTERRAGDTIRRMCDLISLPQELIMHTIVTYLGLNDSIRFIQVCAHTTFAHKIHLIYSPDM